MVDIYATISQNPNDYWGLTLIYCIQKNTDSVSNLKVSIQQQSKQKKFKPLNMLINFQLNDSKSNEQVNLKKQKNIDNNVTNWSNSIELIKKMQQYNEKIVRRENSNFKNIMWEDYLTLILSYLYPHDLYYVSTTSKMFYKLITGPLFKNSKIYNGYNHFYYYLKKIVGINRTEIDFLEKKIKKEKKYIKSILESVNNNIQEEDCKACFGMGSLSLKYNKHYEPYLEWCKEYKIIPFNLLELHEERNFITFLILECKYKDSIFLEKMLGNSFHKFVEDNKQIYIDYIVWCQKYKLIARPTYSKDCNYGVIYV